MPIAVRESLYSLLRRVRRLDRAAGGIGSTEQLSAEFGFDRGTPIDRHYIELFLEQNAADIRGTVLEVVDSRYSRRFGSNRVSRQHVVDLNRANKGATIIGDLSDPTVLPGATFDCIVLTQTLHTIYDMERAVHQVRRSLKPGGVALITVPGITPVRPGAGQAWYWSLTGDALHRLLSEHFADGEVSISTFGNLFAATNFLHGAAVEEIEARNLDHLDLAYPVIVAARAVA